MKKYIIIIFCSFCALVANAKPVHFACSKLDSISNLWGNSKQSKDYIRVADRIKEFVDTKQNSSIFIISHNKLDISTKVDLEHEVYRWAVDNFFSLTKDIEHRTNKGVYFGFNQNVYCGRIGLSKNYYQQYYTSVEIKFYDTEIVVAIYLGDPKMAVGAYASAETYDIQEHYPYVSEGKADAMYALAYRNYEYYLMFPAWDLYQHLNTRHFEIND